MIFQVLIQDISNLGTLYIELVMASFFGILSVYFYLKQKKISDSQEKILKNQYQLTDQVHLLTNKIHEILESWKQRDSAQKTGAKWALHIEIRYLKENLQEIKYLLQKKESIKENKILKELVSKNEVICDKIKIYTTSYSHVLEENSVHRLYTISDHKKLKNELTSNTSEQIVDEIIKIVEIVEKHDVNY